MSSGSTSVQSSPSSPSPWICSRSTHSPDITNSEWAVALIFSCTDPRTVCRLASVNHTFLAATESDVVWSAFLARLSHRWVDLESQIGESMRGISSKEMFFRLTRSIPLLGGRQRYWLDRASGVECYMLSARALRICWGDTPQYWKWVPRAGAWFPEVAYLRQVCWFHVCGTFRETLLPGQYTVSFRLQIRDCREDRTLAGLLRRRVLRRQSADVRQNHALLRANGWDRAPVKFSVRTSEGEEVQSKRRFCEEDCFAASDTPLFEVGREDDEGWVECDAGEFRVEKGGEINVEFAMEETEVLWWKHGLFLDGVLLRPSSCILHQNRGRGKDRKEN